MHLSFGIHVILVEHGILKVAPDHFQGVAGPDVRHGVRALVGRSELGVGGTRDPLVVWFRRERLQRVAERIKPDREHGQNTKIKS